MRLHTVQQAVSQSKMLKLSKCKLRLKRRIPFKKANVNQQKIDACTVYVENFPHHLTLDELSQIFKRAGNIQHVSIPKFKGQSIENKGFAFVEYSSDQIAHKAVELFNNCIPEELTDHKCAGYIPVTGSLTHLRVISKQRWTQYKQEAQQIKREIAALKNSLMTPDQPSPSIDWKAKTGGFEHGTLLKVTGIPSDLKTQNLKQHFGHFGKPCYIDSKNGSN